MLPHTPRHVHNFPGVRDAACSAPAPAPPSMRSIILGGLSPPLPHVLFLAATPFLGGPRFHLQPQRLACSCWRIGTGHPWLRPCAFMYFFRLKLSVPKFLSGGASIQKSKEKEKVEQSARKNAPIPPAEKCTNLPAEKCTDSTADSL